jgi:hypothetical protein
VKQTPSATLQANIRLGNELELANAKIKGERIETPKGVRIWNQVDIRASGYEKLVLWLSPTMVDFSKPILIRLNGRQLGQMKEYRPSLAALLDHLEDGDRQRLFYARIEIGP